jgi:hypothetical protein
MSGDITRSTFDPKKGYTSVRMQQGRLQLDADWNEQADIQNHLRRAYVTDMIGSGSGASKVDPITGKPSDTNFQLRLISTQPLPSRQDQDSGTAPDSTTAPDTAADSGSTLNTNTATEFNAATAIAPGASGSGTKSPATKEHPITDLVLLPGHFYINGILCESTPGSPFTVKGVAANTLQVVDSLTIDGQRLSKGDWLIRDKSPSLAADQPEAVDKNGYLEGWRIRDIDVKTRILTVDGPEFRDGESLTLRRVITYTTQPDFPEATSLAQGTYLAYLDVWERQLSAIDDPTLREVALNVPDTTTRTKTVWQVKLMSLESQPPVNEDDPEQTDETLAPTNIQTWMLETVTDEWEKFQQRTQFRGKNPQGKDYRDLAPQLKACARLCTGTSTNGITANRLGNFLYRVEVHQGNDSDTDPFEKRSTVTFKWSRTNGSVVSPIKKLEGDVIRIAKASQDMWADSQPGQWLELLTLAQELNGKPGILVPLMRVSDTKIEFDPARIIGGAIPDNVTKVRRWDHTVDKAPQGAIPIQTEWIELESGIKVQFYPERTYRTGDYWLIPSRAATNDIEWPSDRADDDVSNQGGPISRPLPQPPNGIDHQYALLSVVDFAGKESVPEVYDQRILFPPLLRALDRAGGVISGDLTIQQDLTVDQTTTTRDLKVTGEFAAKTFRGQHFEIALDPLDPSAPNYGVIKVSQDGDANQVEFQSLENSDFVFRDGKVGIGKAPEQDLDVAGTVDALQLTQEGKSVALQESLDSHIADNSNPHQVTAQQINDRDSGNQIVAQINAGADSQDQIREGRIDDTIARQSAVDSAINTVTQQLDAHINANNPHNITAKTINGEDSNQIVIEINKKADDNNIAKIDPRRIDDAIARTANLTLHTGNSQNPHQVTAEQIDQNNGPHRLVTQINAGTGIIEEKNIAPEIARTMTVNELVNEELQKIRTDFLPRTGGTITGSLETAQLRVGENPSFPDQAKAYIQDDLYVGGGIFAGRLEAENIQSNNFIQLSSEALKEDISYLSSQDVAEGLSKLNPVRFRYKQNSSGQISTGFLAEEVPDFLATPDHKGVKLMDVIALLTKAVQEHRWVVKQLSVKVKQQDQEIAELKQTLSKLIPPDS